MGVTSAMNTAGQIQDTFGGGGFARVYVSENTNVSVYGEVCHNYSRLEERKFARYFTRFFFRFLAFLHFLCRNLCVKPEKSPGWRGANGCRRALRPVDSEVVTGIIARHRACRKCFRMANIQLSMRIRLWQRKRLNVPNPT